MINAVDPDLIWVRTPFERADARPVIAASRAGAHGVLDLGRDRDRALDMLHAVAGRAWAPFGVRVGARCAVQPDELPRKATTVVVAPGVDPTPWRGEGRRVVIEVTSLDEAELAIAAGADGLVAKGLESGGRVGHTGAYVLLQQIRSISDIPTWVQGGIGRHTAAAAIVGGATGVVVDSQTALLRESTVPAAIKAVVASMDGSETRVLGGHRVYNRPDLWVAKADGLTTADEIADRLGADDLTTDAVPLGMDAAFAAGFKTRYGTIGMMVAGLRRSIFEHIAAAASSQPLAPGTGVAASVGTRYPVVQGPMTRVSDQPSFAAAVADGGGLPFLALALLPADQVRTLLEGARELLGDQPWGVGILGFVPKELRDAQLAVIQELKPPMALIAGGRPSQAAPLEADGIKTFLHVPSPGLLSRFYKDGARRFIFEGSECGGHVGPRTSFALWEAQVETLLEQGNLAGTDVLFAGGIHDERSAAMVGALSAPLVAAGANVGVLMGTAYLFTEESVSAGAITAEFQQQAIACRRTALLESGPGHATRCAVTPFVDTFEATRRELMEQGADPTVIWAELENLNLGRLRLASKGLKREGGEIVEVDEVEQRRDGMYMIGDVATMHDEITTVTALHETVTTGSNQFLETVAASVDTGADAAEEAEFAAQPADIAIVGMSCVLPGARDVEEFWHNIVNGVNSITEVPPERFDIGMYFDPDYDHGKAQKSDEVKSASKWGGFLPDIEFDALKYGIPPASLAAIEPVQLLALKAATDALADAGYAQREFNRERTSVIFGAEGGTDQSAAHSLSALLPTYLGGDIPEELKQFLPKMTEDSFPGLLTNVIAGRISNRLDLGGKNLTVDAACASSLAALDVACAELAAGSSDIVLCGGADLHNGVHDFLLFTSVHALSVKGQCQTFDADADGIVLGEGIACVVLKRLADAERDGDRIYGVVKAVAGSSDGRSLGLTAPRQQGQERCVRRAYARAGVSPAEVQLVEAHGTGTVVGDRTEMATLTASFTEAGAAPGSCVLGSVKSNIGHTKCAAGLAGLIKAAKAVYHGVLPPTLNIQTPNREWDKDKSPFVFLDEARPWLSEHRVAGISAFGFGGTNFHAIIQNHEEEPVPDHGLHHWPSELFLFKARTDAELETALSGVLAKLGDGPSPDRWRFRDAAAAVAAAGRGPVRVAIVADDADDLRGKIEQARQGQSVPGVYLADTSAATEGDNPKVAFLFPGQGSQRPGMVGDLFAAFPAVRDVLRLGPSFERTMLPPAAFTPEAQDEQKRALTDTRVAQPALGIADLAVAGLLERLGITPAALGGHSYGELVALCAAGAFDAETLVALSVARADAILEAAGDDPGAMLAVPAPREQVEAIIAGLGVVVANDNHPTQLVLAGPTDAIATATEKLREAGVRGKRLPVACAFHSPVVAGAADTLAARLDEIEVHEPRLPVWSNLTAGEYPTDTAEVRRLLAGQVANGVRFTDEIRSMHAAGVRVFVEVGPGRVLTQLVDNILGDEPHVAVATDRVGDNGVRALLHAAARLATLGVPVDPTALFEGRDVEPTRFTKPAKRSNWVVNGHLVRTTANGAVVPGGLKPADQAPQFAMVAGDGSVVAGSATAPAVPQVDQEQILASYFQTANQLISSGRDLMLQYLGVPGTPQAYAPAPVAPMAYQPLTQPMAPPAPAPAGTTVAVPRDGGGATAAPGTGTAPPPAPVAAAPAGFVLPSKDELLTSLTEIVSVRTGYPADMLDPDLDVEADLSIDSIKRIEILGELADSLGLADTGGMEQMEDLVEELAQRKTLRGIVDWLYERADLLGAGTGGTAAPVAAAAGAAAPAAAPVPAGFVLPSKDELLTSLTSIVSLRTGYPEDMLDPDLDVEADLSIDSIKRIEILGELADSLGLADSGGMEQMEDLVEELAQRKTLRGIVDWLYERADLLGAGTGGTAAPVAAAAGAVAPAAAPVPAGFVLPTREALLGQLVEIVSLRTGYPADMLDPDLDVEADLSIDSIKRIEILGELADQLGLSDAGGMEQMEDLVEELAQRKTLRGIVEWLYERAELLGFDIPGATPAPAPAPLAAAPATAPAAAEASGGRAVGSFGEGRGTAVSIPATAQRFEVALTDLAPPAGSVEALASRTVAVCGTNAVADALADQLTAHGADVRICRGDVLPDGTSLIVFTHLLDAQPPSIPDLYAKLQRHLLQVPADVVVVSGLGGGLGIDPPAPVAGGDPLPVGAGIRGLVKTATVEFGDRAVRLVDLDPSEPVGDLVAALELELADTTAPVEIGLRAGARRGTELRAIDAPSTGGDLGLGADSVVLLTGGARGITARAAIALARTSSCRIELVGRSPLPTGDEDPDLAGCPDKLSLRTALIAKGMREPKAIEKECNRILAAREVRETLDALAAAGSVVTYHSADVRNEAALTFIVESIYERHGRLDGVVHGAGILDDHLIGDKTPEAFRSVFTTKVDAARTLLRSLRDGTRFVVFFGSIAGVVGNRGQADYAAANDALDAMAAANAGAATRVVSLDWGPWAPDAGMVSDTLAKLFAENGMGLIELADGTAVLVDEAAAPAGRAQVVVCRCEPSMLTFPTPAARRAGSLGAGGAAG